MQPAPPCSARTCWWWLWVLGVAYTHNLWVLFIYFSSQLCCPLRFQDSPQTRQWECFLVFGNFYFKTPFPGWISIATSFVSLFISFILPYLLSKTIGCLSGCVMSFASIQKLFCWICSAFKCSFNEFVREKVVSLSYSSAFLGPPLCRIFRISHV